MINFYENGPKEQFHAELNRVNREGLLYLLIRLVNMIEALTGVPMNRADLLEAAKYAKEVGLWEAASLRYRKIFGNPVAAYRAHLRRSKAAKKSARRRKAGR